MIFSSESRWQAGRAEEAAPGIGAAHISPSALRNTRERYLISPHHIGLPLVALSLSGHS